MGTIATLLGLALLGAPNGTPDVSAARIPDVPLSGMLAGDPFRATEAWMDADGMSSMKLQGVGEDRIRPYKFRFMDRRGFGDSRDISIRIQADWDRRLDGSTIVWRPYPDESPEDHRQKTMTSGKVRFARGITKVFVTTHRPGKEPEMQTYRDRISARIEFGKVKDGYLSGRLILALPDRARSVISGTFRAQYRVRHEGG